MVTRDQHRLLSFLLYFCYGYNLGTLEFRDSSILYRIQLSLETITLDCVLLINTTYNQLFELNSRTYCSAAAAKILYFKVTLFLPFCYSPICIDLATKKEINKKWKPVTLKFLEKLGILIKHRSKANFQIQQFEIPTYS